MSRWGTYEVIRSGKIYDIHSDYHGNREEGEGMSQRGEATGTKRGAAGIITNTSCIQVCGHNLFEKIDD